MELDDDLKAVELEEKQRMGNLVGFVLTRFAEGVSDRGDAISSILDTARSSKAAERPMRDLVARCVAEATDGCLTVTEYSQKSKSKQMVYVYVGTHWVLIPLQMFYDFVRTASLRCGLPDMYVNDPEYMNTVFEAVAFRVARFRKTEIPDDEVWINVKNGTLKIGSNGLNGSNGSNGVRLCPHDKGDFFLYCLDYCYDPDAVCLGWLKFLDEVLPELEAQQVLAEAIGYCFTKGMKLEKMFVFYGTGSNGKSVVLDIIEFLLGKSNVSNVSLSSLTMDDEKRSLIENKLVNISHESGRNIDTAILKQLVSGEPTDVRILYRGTHTMYNYGKLFTSFNKLPPAEHTYGFYRRWIVFPFNVTIPDEQQDTALTLKLKKEASGILNWVLAVLPGLLERRAFTDSSVCKQAMQEYKRRSNSAITFLEDRCVKTEDGRYKLKDLYSKYCTFCHEEGIQNKFGKTAFRDILDGWGAEHFTYQNGNYYKLYVKSEDEVY